MTLLEPLHPADIADLIEQISSHQQRQLINLSSWEFDGDILAELEDSILEECVAVLLPDLLVEVVCKVKSDEVFDLFKDLEEPKKHVILLALPQPIRIVFEQFQIYLEFSVGSPMQHIVLMPPEYRLVGETNDSQLNAKNLQEQLYYITLVVSKLQRRANVTVSKLMSSPSNMPLVEIGKNVLHITPMLQNVRDSVQALGQYHLIFTSNSDVSNWLTSRTMIDDALAVLGEENKEGILCTVVATESNLSDPIWKTIKQRFPWLAVNLVPAILSLLVIAQFEGTLPKIFALAAFMLIVNSMGGNAGTQSLPVAVRALATRDLKALHLLVVGRCQTVVSLLNE